MIDKTDQMLASILSFKLASVLTWRTISKLAHVLDQIHILLVIKKYAFANKEQIKVNLKIKETKNERINLISISQCIWTASRDGYQRSSKCIPNARPSRANLN
uniref:Uncharacterized protein n=1 Tax=Romanomermis culicivorax TaxID=13658 RepID=A0A915K986_ROMCU